MSIDLKVANLQFADQGQKCKNKFRKKRKTKIRRGRRKTKIRRGRRKTKIRRGRRKTKIRRGRRKTKSMQRRVFENEELTLSIIGQ